MKSFLLPGAGRDVVRHGLVTALALLLIGCAHTPVVTTATRASIYDRASVHFDKTVFVKPPESLQPEFRLAPMLIQQILTTDEPPPTPHAVYFWRTSALLGTEVLPQFNYLWFQSAKESEPKIPQGVRITFDPAGKPILWEVLWDDSGARILFVSQSLESAAMTNYPASLPGRRFWIERGVTDDPNTVVARIIDDSPLATGPILYLQAGTYDVSTLICRCMNAQAREVVGESTYGLASLDEAAVRWLSQDKSPGITRWLPGRPADQLTKWLRIKGH